MDILELTKLIKQRRCLNEQKDLDAQKLIKSKHWSAHNIEAQHERLKREQQLHETKSKLADIEKKTTII